MQFYIPSISNTNFHGRIDCVMIDENVIMSLSYYNELLEQINSFLQLFGTCHFREVDVSYGEFP